MPFEGRAERTAWTPWLVLLLGGVVTALGTGFVQRSVVERDQARFEQVVRAAEHRLTMRVEAHLAILRATAGFFSVVPDPSREEFARYVGGLRLAKFYPGIQGLGFLRRVPASELGEVVAQVRAQVAFDFRVWPDTPRDEYYIVTLLEPMEPRNQLALGYDMATEAVRRHAMMLARDSGRATMSGKVTLVQETDFERQQPGMLLYLPVYRQGEIPATVAARREGLQGFAYSPLRAHDFFASVFGGADSPVGLDVYDGDRVDEEAQLYTSGEQRTGTFTTVRTMMVAGRPWTIRYTSLAAFDAQSDRSLPAIFAAVGIVVSGLLFALVRLEVRTRRANEFAALLRQRLLAIVSHDLRNPLTAITMGAGVLERNKCLPAPARGLVKKIEGSAQRMGRLIAQLLDFARIEQGMGLTVERSRIDVAAVVRQVVEECQLAQPNATLRLEAPPRLEAMADPDRLAEVVSNLVGNALQHGKSPITVRVRARWPDHVAIEVHSMGPAIAPEVVPQLFDPYARGRERCHRRTGSLGLGLYITREIVRGHGGQIEVRPGEQEGNTFTVVLPRGG